jgi:hypothetical protein
MIFCCIARCVMGPSAFERHAGAGSSKKWKASCRVADPDSQTFGRPVIAWLQQHGYEQVEKAPAAAAGAGSNAALAAAAAALGVDVGAGGSNAGKGEGRKQQQLRVQQQRQQQLRQMRLLLAGIPMLQLSESVMISPASAAAATDNVLSLSATAGGDVSAIPALPVVLPSGCFNESWQLPGSNYSNLPAVEAALRDNSSSSLSPSAALKAAQDKLNTAAGAAGSSSRIGPDGLPAMRGKRARILKDGSLTLIPYGHDENMLWLQRVHSFIGAVR